MEKKCAVCDKPAQNKCAACYLVSYCSPAHQQQDWKTHRKNCSFFLIKDDPELGKGFYASRDIKAGTIILDEEPAVQATSWNQPCFFPFPSCISCGLLMTFEYDKQCSKCNWPVCSKYCEELSIHAENECQIFSAKKIKYPPPAIAKPSDLRILIMLLRACVLKWKQPEVYENILQLQSNFSVNEFNDWTWESEISQVKLFVNTETLGISDDELTKLLKIFRINCHSTLLDDHEAGSTIFRSRSVGYLFLKASRMNHSCVPNCCWMVSGKPEFKIRIRTAVPVKKGDPLTIDYYLRETMCGTKQRQEFIRKGGFICKCIRCKDPTELGTFMSAIICSSCKEANTSKEYLLPEDPLDLKDSAIWKCNCCDTVKLASEILPSIEKIGRMISKKDKEFGDNDEDDSFKSLVTFCKNVVSKYSGKSLHPNHWVIQDATRAVLRYLTTHRMSKMDLETSQYYVKCGLYLLAIQDVVSPGCSPNRGYLQQQLAIALHDQVAELYNNGKYQEAVNGLDKCIAMRAEAIKYFQTEFPKTDGSLSKADVLKQNMELAMEEKTQIVLQLMQMQADHV